MRQSKNIYYVRAAKQPSAKKITWTEWYGPIVAWGPYTAALHIARILSSNEARTRILTQIITNEDETLEIEFNINNMQITTAKT